MKEPVQIHGLTSEELVRRSREAIGPGSGIARNVYRDALLRGMYDPGVHGASVRTAERWRETFAFGLPDVRRVVDETSLDATTTKAILRLADGLEVECVRIPMGRGKHTLCVSTQVGCKMGCTFCETGRMGFLRQLTTAEIVSQPVVVRTRLAWTFERIVFMGMGEALDNFDALAQAIAVLTDPRGVSMPQESLTVCTVGSVDGIRRLAALGLRRLELSVSLNAGNDTLRSELMPINRRTPLVELQRALIEYRPRRNFCFAINYCLLPGINDTREDVRQVAQFCAPLGRVMVNVIPYNPGSTPITRPPTEGEIEQFMDWLNEEGLPVRRRITRGRDVMAACGQLGNVQLRRSVRRRPEALP